VTLGRKFVLYLVLVHLALAAAAVGLYRISPWWTILAEAVLAASLLTGIMLLRQSRMTREQGITALALIRSGEFTTRLLDTGVPEVDALVSAYNAMSGDLREQRVRLQEQQWFLEKIVAASPSGIVTLDLDGKIADVNPAARRWFGAGEESFRGRRLDELPAAFGTGLSGLGSGESRLVTEAGPRKFRCRLSEFVDLGFTRRFLLIDELSEELHRSERAAFEKLIRVMAHEINNSVGAGNSLLASCKAFAVELGPASRREFESALGLAIARGEHLNVFLNRFADVFRLPAPRLETLDLSELLRGSVRLMQAGADPGISWRIELPPGAWLVRADRYHLEQVVINVLKNAREAVSTAGTIMIARVSSDATERLEISDSGPGIDPVIAGQLFSPFFSTKSGGQGIGLTMAREILDAHGFRFGLDNREGGGAVFWIEPR
jgi:nitrogen fixation/metabolism regulation signal transduction histidine kinase